MVIKLTGTEVVKYTNKQGRDVSGVRLYYLEEQDIPSDRGIGKRAANQYISDQVALRAPALVVGRNYNVYFNRYGNVEDIIEA